MNTRRQFLKKVGRGTAAMASMPLLGCTPLSAPWPPPDGVDDDDFWQLVRSQFPLTHERTYLNTGGLGPASYPVLDRVQRTVMELQAICETGHHEIEESRAPVAAFFGVQPSEIAFMRNATEGNATVASGLRTMQAGDEVIFESHAHPGGAIPWMNRQKQQGIKVKIFEPDPTSAEGNLERIADLITPRTRVIQISHVTAPTGIRLPAKAIADLAHEHDCWFHIDGAQSAGMITFDLKEIGCDSYATSGHKWMGAPHGTGVLYIREDRLDEVAPTEVGAYSDNGYHLPDEFAYNPMAQRYEPGTRDATKALGVAASVAFLEQIGMDRVAAYGHGLAQYLQAQLRQMDGVMVLTPEDPSLSGSITTFKTDKVPHDELYQFFSQEFQMRCRIVNERDINAVRISTHIFNNKADCDRVVEATHAALKNG